MAAVFTDIGADAVKIGMLYSAELIEAVTEALNKHRARNIVLDPVMVAQSGDKLLQDDAIQAIKDHLMPLADVVTPNLPEAEVLLGRHRKHRGYATGRQSTGPIRQPQCSHQGGTSGRKQKHGSALSH